MDRVKGHSFAKFFSMAYSSALITEAAHSQKVSKHVTHYMVSHERKQCFFTVTAVRTSNLAGYSKLNIKVNRECPLHFSSESFVFPSVI